MRSAKRVQLLEPGLGLQPGAAADDAAGFGQVHGAHVRGQDLHDTGVAGRASVHLDGCSSIDVAPIDFAPIDFTDGLTSMRSTVTEPSNVTAPRALTCRVATKGPVGRCSWSSIPPRAGHEHSMCRHLRGGGQERSVEGEGQMGCEVAAVGRVGEYDDVGRDTPGRELLDDGREDGGPAPRLDRSQLDQEDRRRQPVERHVVGSAAGQDDGAAAFRDRLGSAGGEHPITYRHERDHRSSVGSTCSACAITAGSGARPRSRIHRMISTSAVMPSAVPNASQNARAWSSSNAWPNR